MNGPKLPVVYADFEQKPKSKAILMLECALAILDDQCPKDPEKYLCKKSEFYDETACKRCWEGYLYHLINSQEET